MEQHLDAAQICARLHISRRTLSRMISGGEFPDADWRRGRNLRRWRTVTVERWMKFEQRKTDGKKTRQNGGGQACSS